MTTKLDEVMDFVKLQQEINRVLAEAKKKAPAAEPEPAKETKSEPEKEPESKPESQNEEQLAQAIAALLELIQGYAASLQAFYNEVQNGAEKLKQEIVAAVQEQLKNQQVSGSPVAKPPIKKVK